MLLHSLAGRQTVEFLKVWQTVCCPLALPGGHSPLGVLFFFFLGGGVVRLVCLAFSG